MEGMGVLAVAIGGADISNNINGNSVRKDNGIYIFVYKK